MNHTEKALKFQVQAETVLTTKGSPLCNVLKERNETVHDSKTTKDHIHRPKRNRITSNRPSLKLDQEQLNNN